MRDLRIGGGGNLVGGEEDGLIDCVGLDVYCEMVKEGIEERRGDRRGEDKLEGEMDVEMDGYTAES